MSRQSDFQRLVERKTRAAERAIIPPLSTTDEGPHARRLRTIGNAWTRAHYDGDYHLFDPPTGPPAMSIVFVQSRDRNTVITNPARLGGGAADTHLIYEGLSRVAADAVLAGAATVGASGFFTVWHPELVSLRHDMGLPRHPAQIVMSRRGRVNLSALLFNVPEIPVFLVGGDEVRRELAREIAERPWITLVPLSDDGMVGAFTRLRLDHGLSRISVVGGRSAASALVDAGLVQDLNLTTTSHDGGEPDTPYYSGAHPPQLELIVRKHGLGDTAPITFEHFVLADV
jgi:riboflavin biosynthesis pyrimidine reductase